ncbi:7-carboxy-7-deazaguanine synthase QueE [Methanobrevibacter arboriphilus]|jgi:organic radical activating enzyme|nr:7-carboxy-7-deazaguanine synthase QueE [Methanobrevibacter arboriphilus]
MKELVKELSVERNDLMKAPIVEIFSSFQGEGLWIGKRQIFVRFAGCNLNCNYCDTKDSQNVNNGILKSVEEVVKKIKELKTPDLHSISFTGGEPLLYFDFINEIISQIDFKIMIETNGTLPDFLSKINNLNCVSLDLKLPEHFNMDWNEEIFNNEVLSIKSLIANKKNFYCKIVVSPSTSLNTIKGLGEKIHKIFPNDKFFIVIQPESPIKQWKNKSHVFFKFSESLGEYFNVFVIPQTHKILNIE